VPGPSPLETGISIAKLKKYKLPGSDQIPVALFQAGSEILLSVIHRLNNAIWNMEELPDEWEESIIYCINSQRG
jgi:hypothetical protein